MRGFGEKLAASPCRVGGARYANRSAQRFWGRGLAGLGAVYLLSLVLGAVIFAQMLGLTHGLAHGSHQQQLASAEFQLHQHEAADDHETNGLDSLFASHDDGSDNCRIFDQQSYSALISAVASLALPGELPAGLQPNLTGCDLVGALAAFEARAPPFFR